MVHLVTNELAPSLVVGSRQNGHKSFYYRNKQKELIVHIDVLCDCGTVVYGAIASMSLAE